MIQEYIAVELCEQLFGGIKEATFRRNKEYYLGELEKEHNVRFGKRGRHITYILDPKEQTEQQKADTEFFEILGCDIGGKNIELMKFILKSIIEQKIVPVQDEIALQANRLGLWGTDSRGTVKNYMAFLKDNGIIVEPMEIPIWIENPIINRDGKEIWIKRKCDPDTGEILPTFHKRIVKHYYFDCVKNEAGKVIRRERVSDTTARAIEMAFNNLWTEAEQRELLSLYALGYTAMEMKKERSKVQARIIREIGREFGMCDCIRKEEPIINPTIKRQLNDYFNQQDNGAWVQ
ncbi:hypothetical protein [Neobacillus sp. DY30]|uniref:hypothetical protein n=1 Tax=Neobacillus sp. DY30 TaxID=3047871 RepID=UPI0024BFFE98|nr:hypothetical protein [Neobacillus sp. DY30]WHX99304.1 hypothetical protein QNH29_22335 [Neobacillus sp. DY30]